MPISRMQILAHLHDQIAMGVPIVGAGAGTGLSGKCAEAGGADLIVIDNSGRFRMAGHGSLSGVLAYGDANAIVMDMAREALPVVRKAPVLAGVNGTDPFRLMDVFLAEVKRVGFAGVQNLPTVGVIDGVFRQNLEETGMSYAKEVEMIALAHAMDLLTTPYVFDEAQAQAMARAGADVLVAHMGLTAKGLVGARTAKTLDQCVGEIQKIHDAAKAVRSDVLVICHGGPISKPADAAYILERTRGVVGFYGASSMERLPAETAIIEQVQRFKTLPMR
ncbi:MAG TPA: phosphoenolpyruvate hydrolase family protein [Vicinamibacterales bacterium]|nr:phosphoenolpyruvate hydrolase family protein [Vicinamibacterales bacterium]